MEVLKLRLRSIYTTPVSIKHPFQY
jgi:hypothetical protein